MYVIKPKVFYNHGEFFIEQVSNTAMQAVITSFTAFSSNKISVQEIICEEKAHHIQQFKEFI